MRTSQTSIAALLLAASTILPAATLAQSSPPPGTSGTSVPTTKQAPVGHRQPRAGDAPLPPAGAEGSVRDKEVDRVLNSICRGC